MESAVFPFPPKGWNKTMAYRGQPVLSIYLQRPSFPETGKTARIERYFAHAAQLWINRWKEHLFPSACKALSEAAEGGSVFHPWRAELNYTLTYWHDPIFSLRFDVIESKDNPRPQRFCMGETWDCSTGYPRSLRSFFPGMAVAWRKRILASLKQQADQQISSGESLLAPECKQIMDRAFDPDRFYLTDNGIALFYPLYILGPYAEGIPVFTIPFPEQSVMQTDSGLHPSPQCDESM